MFILPTISKKHHGFTDINPFPVPHTTYSYSNKGDVKQLKWHSVKCLCIAGGLALILSGCGSDNPSAAPQGSYKETKTMVIDILKSDEGKKALEEAIFGERSSGETSSNKAASGSNSSGSGNTSKGLGIKMLNSQSSSDEIRLAVKDTLSSPEYKKEFEEIMKDPKFAGDFAKVVNSQSKQIHMELIKDPSYQKSMEDMLKSPEMTKMLLQLTQTADYRKQTMSVMQEAMQNPIFRMEIMELLQSVVKEELQPKQSEGAGGDQEKKDQSNSQGDKKEEGGGSGSGS